LLRSVVTFLDFRISEGSIAAYCRSGANLFFTKSLTEFSDESNGEIILKIGSHL